MSNINQTGIKPDFILIQCDGNGTCVLGDTTKQINTIVSEVAGVIIYKWEEKLPAMSYKDYIKKIRIPGDKYDKEIKAKQEAEIEKFIPYLKDSNHPLYNKALNLYNDLAANYLDPKSGKVSFNLFPSIIELINKIDKISKYTFTLRTFGFDGAVIAKEFSKLSELGKFGSKKLELERRVNFINNGIQVENDNEIKKGVELFRIMQATHLLGQDQINPWHTSGGKAVTGKLAFCVEDGKFEGKNVLTIFLDDNLKKRSSQSKGQPADPNEQNIAYPMDIYGRATSWDSKGIIGIRVNPIKAALNKDYIINKVNKQLTKRGFVSLT